MRIPNMWYDTFLAIARDIAQQSKDDSTQCGAVLVAPDKVILSTGFNGPPPQMEDDKVPWNTRPEKYAFVLHAEENALWYAVGSHGFDRIKGSTMFCTHAPCSECTLRMLRCGIGAVVIPANTMDYPLSKYQVDPKQVLSCAKVQHRFRVYKRHPNSHTEGV